MDIIDVNKLEKKKEGLQESIQNLSFSNRNDELQGKINGNKAEITRIERIIRIKKQGDDCNEKYKNGYERYIRKQACRKIDDKFDRREKAKKIAEIVNKRKVKTVGIFGGWGTGKSTFLEYIREELDSKKTKIIDIKATEYSDQEAIWAYFYAKMKESVKRDYVLMLRYFLLRAWKNRKKLVAFLTKLVLTGFLIEILFYYNLFNSFGIVIGMDKDAAYQINNGINWIITIVFVIKWLMPFVHETMESILADIDSLSKQAQRDTSQKMGYKIVIKEYIGEILSIWNKYRFIFCVDELDRCNNDAIMAFLDSIQLLEDYSSISIIYTIDEKIIINAIKESGFCNPSEYLKKYIDIGYNLPIINVHSEYIDRIADEYGFDSEERARIKLAFKELDKNVSIRNLYSIFNSLSELKERWIKREIVTQKYLKEDFCDYTVDWINSIAIAILYFAGSSWPLLICADLMVDVAKDRRAYLKVEDCIDFMAKNARYGNCPDFLMQGLVIDVINAMYYLKDMKPLYDIG